HHQEDILRLEGPKPGPPVHVVPHGIPEPLPGPPERAEKGGPMIVTLGIVSSTAKRMQLLLAGFARVGTAIPDAKLDVVGEIGEGEEETLLPLIGELGLTGSVRLSGRAEKERYWGALQSADLAVQLRSGFNAGGSGAVCDCIAARLPVITSSIGWATELPEN